MADNNQDLNESDRQNPMGNRETEREDAPNNNPSLAEIQENNQNDHWTMQLVDRLTAGIKGIIDKVKNRLSKFYDSKHYPLIVYIMSIVVNGFMDIMGWYNLFEMPGWVQFSYLLGGLIAVGIYYVSYYHKIYYRINNAEMDVVLIYDRVTHKLQILFTGSDNIQNDDNIKILGGDKLAEMDAVGALGKVKIARGIVDGSEDDNDLEEGEIGLITTPDELNKIEAGDMFNGKDVHKAILQNRHMLINRVSDEDEAVLDELKMIERSYQAVLNNVVTDLQKSGYIDSNVSLGEIVTEVKGDEHFMADDSNTVAGIDVSNLSEAEKKQLQMELNMDMQSED